MVIYFFRRVFIFAVLFFLILKPMNEYLLGQYIVPSLKKTITDETKINFNHSNDNLIFILNGSNYFFNLPFNEYYTMFFITFSPRVLSKKYLIYHILNFTPILIIPFTYYASLNGFESLIMISTIIQGTINFCYVIKTFLNFLKKSGFKSFEL